MCYFNSPLFASFIKTPVLLPKLWIYMRRSTKDHRDSFIFRMNKYCMVIEEKYSYHNLLQHCKRILFNVNKFVIRYRDINVWLFLKKINLGELLNSWAKSVTVVLNKIQLRQVRQIWRKQIFIFPYPTKDFLTLNEIFSHWIYIYIYIYMSVALIISATSFSDMPWTDLIIIFLVLVVLALNMPDSIWFQFFEYLSLSLSLSELVDNNSPLPLSRNSRGFLKDFYRLGTEPLPRLGIQLSSRSNTDEKIMWLERGGTTTSEMKF